MNDTLSCIADRYTCRDFTDTPLTDEEIKTIVDAALTAPSAMNRQPWRLVMIRNKALVDELDADGMSILAAAEDKSAYERMMSRGGKLLYNAPCLMVILSDGTKWSALDSGILCQNAVLAAQSIGLASCIVGMAAVPLSGPRAEEFRKRLEFPDGYEFIVGVLFGTAKSEREPHETDGSKVAYIN
jgi:nitroreductase